MLRAVSSRHYSEKTSDHRIRPATNFAIQIRDIRISQLDYLWPTLLPSMLDPIWASKLAAWSLAAAIRRVPIE